jgi:hypothetical protein
MQTGRCKHFNGIQNDTCKAGVLYESVTPDPQAPGMALRMPCDDWSKRKTLSKPTPAQQEQMTKRGTCPKYEEPSAEELKAWEDKLKVYGENMNKVFTALASIRKDQKGKNWRGVIECPACKGKLHLTHSAYNGHMHGRCETEGCVAWME